MVVSRNGVRRGKGHGYAFADVVRHRFHLVLGGRQPIYRRVHRNVFYDRVGNFWGTQLRRRRLVRRRRPHPGSDGGKRKNRRVRNRNIRIYTFGSWGDELRRRSIYSYGHQRRMDDNVLGRFFLPLHVKRQRNGHGGRGRHVRRRVGHVESALVRGGFYVRRLRRLSKQMDRSP